MQKPSKENEQIVIRAWKAYLFGTCFSAFPLGVVIYCTVLWLNSDTVLQDCLIWMIAFAIPLIALLLVFLYLCILLWMAGFTYIFDLSGVHIYLRQMHCYTLNWDQVLYIERIKIGGYHRLIISKKPNVITMASYKKIQSLEFLPWKFHKEFIDSCCVSNRGLPCLDDAFMLALGGVSKRKYAMIYQLRLKGIAQGIK